MAALGTCCLAREQSRSDQPDWKQAKNDYSNAVSDLTHIAQSKAGKLGRKVQYVPNTIKD